MQTPDAKKSQLDRFAEVANELDADQSADALDRIMGKLDLTKKPEADPRPIDKK